MKTAAIVAGSFALFLQGCPVTGEPRHDITAELACETARLAVRLRGEIAPAPASDKCENCNGTGSIGDGRIVHQCPVCKGTGRKPKK